ncbi:hypothetical protein CTheo_860 [Ceratobasidium theobromae]|uniref:Uncharacterized protein n=1 Tax=Ceratobasidium theobromae TaxID=1582974 RepID=A0A5N5QV27_9AGAM|nr:hypothetical protein CTheo_860 [Ceratobasidium theobromae]
MPAADEPEQDLDPVEEPREELELEPKDVDESSEEPKEEPEESKGESDSEGPKKDSDNSEEFEPRDPEDLSDDHAPGSTDSPAHDGPEQSPPLSKPDLDNNISDKPTANHDTKASAHTKSSKTSAAPKLKSGSNPITHGRHPDKHKPPPGSGGFPPGLGPLPQSGKPFGGIGPGPIPPTSHGKKCLGVKWPCGKRGAKSTPSPPPKAKEPAKLRKPMPPDPRLKENKQPWYVCNRGKKSTGPSKPKSNVAGPSKPAKPVPSTGRHPQLVPPTYDQSQAAYGHDQKVSSKARTPGDTPPRTGLSKANQPRSTANGHIRDPNQTVKAKRN